jgi:hypothetical protein
MNKSYQEILSGHNMFIDAHRSLALHESVPKHVEVVDDKRQPGVNCSENIEEETGAEYIAACANFGIGNIHFIPAY